MKMIQKWLEFFRDKSREQNSLLELSLTQIKEKSSTLTQIHKKFIFGEVDGI
jgi:hypothetical protein